MRNRWTLRLNERWAEAIFLRHRVTSKQLRLQTLDEDGLVSREVRLSPDEARQLAAQLQHFHDHGTLKEDDK